VPEALVASAMQEVKYFDDVGFHDVKISVKHSTVPLMIESYRLLADTTDYPLHLGVTEAGPLPGGLIKSVAGIATLLSEGIGDTIRLSLTADPVEEAKTGRALLEYLGLRERTTLDFIACPSCGRAEVDVIKVANEANERLEALGFPIQVAVMGCVVNGPGEAREADLGLAAGKGRGHLFIKGEVVRVVPEADMVDALIDEAKLLIEQGTEARLAAGDVNAADLAEEARLELISVQGDANATAAKRQAVKDLLDAEGSD
jgi:(E)-4-hydroxy-3-methylbut-2-enyl-diphosphate synthase